MKSYSIRGALKPNHNYVCPSCLLGRPFALSRQTLRFKSTDAIGVYPTPDQSVAALLWSNQEAIAKAARKSGEAIAKPTKTPGAAKREATKPAVVAKKKGTKKGKGKVSKASDRQRTTVESQTPAWEDEPVTAVPISSILSSILDEKPPVHKTPTSLTKSLQKKSALAKAASLHQRTQAVKGKQLGQTPKYDGEQNAGRDDMAISGQADIESAVKAAERSEKPSSGKSEELPEHAKGGLAKISAKNSGSVNGSTAKKRKSPTGKAKASKAKAAKSPLTKKHPSGLINKQPSGPLTIRKLETDVGGVARRVRTAWNLNDVIKKTEAALERRTLEARRDAKTERLNRARARAQVALAGRKTRTSSVKSSREHGTFTIKKTLKKTLQQESDADVQTPVGTVQTSVGTDIQTVNAADLDIARR